MPIIYIRALSRDVVFFIERTPILAPFVSIHVSYEKDCQAFSLLLLDLCCPGIAAKAWGCNGKLYRVARYCIKSRDYLYAQGGNRAAGALRKSQL